MRTFACYSKDNEIRMKSSSGGIFSLFAQTIIYLNGVVYGVAMSEDCYFAEFIRVTDEKELARLRGSKYMQAKMGSIYLQVKKDLIENRKVLFTGTGCQINGLKKYLQKEYNNLYCIDVICHGTPSQALWEKYVKYIESKNTKIIDVNFRCKDKSLKQRDVRDKTLYISKNEDSYMQMFLNDYCLRPSCYKCKVKEYKMSDVTIADFWGVEEVVPEANDNKGTSLAILRTEKGKNFFEEVTDKMFIKEVDYEEAIKGNLSDFCSAKRPKERDSFYVDMNEKEFTELERKYVTSYRNPYLAKIKKLVKSIFLEFRKDKRRYWQDYGLMFGFRNGEE